VRDAEGRGATRSAIRRVDSTLKAVPAPNANKRGGVHEEVLAFGGYNVKARASGDQDPIQ